MVAVVAADRPYVMQHGTTPLPLKVDYGRMPRSVALRRLVWPALMVLLFLATPIIFWVCVRAYTAHKWGAVTPGMRRVQVDQELRAFRSYPSQYSGLGPGEFVIRYELLGMGKWTMIQVVYNADGTVLDAHPLFNN